MNQSATRANYPYKFVSVLIAAHPTVEAEFELNQDARADGTRDYGVKQRTGEWCAWGFSSSADAERAALAHLRGQSAKPDDDANPDYVRGYNAGLVDAGLPDSQIEVPAKINPDHVALIGQLMAMPSPLLRFAQMTAKGHFYDVAVGVQYHATDSGEVLGVFTSEAAAWAYVFDILDCQI